MNVNVKIIVSICLFWVLCFFIGYYVIPIPPTVQVNAQTPSSASISGNTTQYTQSESQQTIILINNLASYEPTDEEVLGIETYSNESLIQPAPKMDGFKACDDIDYLTINSVQNPYDMLAILNKQNKLDYDFAPFDLVPLSKYNIKFQYGNVYLRAEVAEQFNALYQDMTSNGYKIKVSSGWRSLSMQQKILIKWEQRVGKANANNYAALPGHSEHHFGTAVDILTSENGYSINANYFKTKSFKWLSENAYKYGFVLSYPQGKESITGYNPEAWHYRYVGIDTATVIYQKGTTLAEYLYDLNGYCY